MGLFWAWFRSTDLFVYRLTTLFTVALCPALTPGALEALTIVSHACWGHWSSVYHHRQMADDPTARPHSGVHFLGPCLVPTVVTGSLRWRVAGTGLSDWWFVNKALWEAGLGMGTVECNLVAAACRPGALGTVCPLQKQGQGAGCCILTDFREKECNLR